MNICNECKYCRKPEIYSSPEAWWTCANRDNRLPQNPVTGRIPEKSCFIANPEGACQKFERNQEPTIIYTIPLGENRLKRWFYGR